MFSCLLLLSPVTYRNTCAAYALAQWQAPPWRTAWGAPSVFRRNFRFWGISEKGSLGTPVRLRPDQTSWRKRSEEGKTSGVKTPARGPSSSRGTSRASRQCPHTFAGVDHSYWVRRPPDRKGANTYWARRPPDRKGQGLRTRHEAPS